MPRYDRIGLTIALAAVCFSMAAVVLAQTAPSFTVSVSPELPSAGERVTVTVTPENFSAASTTFTWLRDGAVLPALSGLGRSNLTLTTNPDATEVIQIRVTVNPGPGFSRGEGDATIYTVPSVRQQATAVRNAASSFTLEASNSNPAPGEEVEVRVVTFAFEKDLADYRWYVNDVLQSSSSGRGQWRITLPGGGTNASRVVRMEVTTPEGEVRTQTLAVATLASAFYWWADTIVPYWYKGKALPSVGSKVTVVALTGAPNPGQLSYQWQFNGSVVSRSSGVGRATFSFTVGLPVEEQISVSVRDTEGTLLKTASLGIAPVSPRVGIYELRPLRGAVYERLINEFTAPAGDEYDFLASPFFFPTERVQNLAYRWTFNGQEISGEFSAPWIMTVKSNPGETSIGSLLDVEVADPSKSGGRTTASIRTSFR